jgi:hypothetical protein
MSDRTNEELFYIREFAGTRLPVYTSHIMPSVSTPIFATAQEAVEHRELDCVLGVRLNGITRAYPLWIMDNVHIVNDTFDDTPLTVIHCERCSSGAAYYPMVDGRVLTFQVAGIWKMTLFIRDEQTNSIWSHSEGVAVDGPLKGKRLARHPCYPTTWERWRRLNPKTQVLLWPENDRHRDGRHGHGARDYLGRPGIRAGESLGVTPERVDERLPENTLVLGIRSPACDRAYPIKDVQRSGGIVHEMVGDQPIVVWSPRLGDHLTGAFSRSMDNGDELTFVLREGALFDVNTDSEWSVEGIAIKGELAGMRLRPLDWIVLKWHAWSPFHPDTELYRAKRDLTEAQLQTDSFSSLFGTLRNAGYRLRFEGQVLGALRPNEAEASAVVRINDDPFHVYRFRDALGAEEFCYGATHTIRVGRYVLKSEPDVQFADNAQLVPLSEDEMAYSALLKDDRFAEAVRQTPGVDAAEAERAVVGLSHLFEGVGKLGYRIEPQQQLEGRRLPVNALNGFELTIDGDPFLVYRFAEPKSALQFCDWHGHSLAVDRFAFRSDPPGQYKAKGLETINRPDESINWSNLIGDEKFVRAVESIVAPVTSPKARS